MARTSTKTGPRRSTGTTHSPWPTRREREGGVARRVVDAGVTDRIAAVGPLPRHALIPQQRQAPELPARAGAVPARPGAVPARPGAVPQVQASPAQDRSDAVTDALLATVPPFGTPPFGTRGASRAEQDGGTPAQQRDAAQARKRGAARPQQHRAAPGAQPQWAHQLAPIAPRNGLGVTALCLALVGLPFALIPLTGIVAALLGSLAVVFGLLGFSRARRGVATNRTVSVIGTALGLLVLGVGVAGLVILFRATGAFVGDLEDLGAQVPSIAPAGAATTVTGGPAYTFRLSGSAPGATVMWSVDGASGGDQAGRLPWDRTISGEQDGYGTTSLTAYTNPGSGGDLTCTIVGSDGRVLDTRTATPTGGAAGSAAVTCSALG